MLTGPTPSCQASECEYEEGKDSRQNGARGLTYAPLTFVTASASEPILSLLSSSPEAPGWFELSYPLQDGAGQLLRQLLPVVPQVAGLVLFVLWKEENEGAWAHCHTGPGNSREGLHTALL